MKTICRPDGLDKIILEITSDLLLDYYSDFEDLMDLELHDLDFNLERKSLDTVLITIPMDLRNIIEGEDKSSDIVSENEEEGTRIVRVNTELLDKSNGLRKFNDALYVFINSALEKKLKSVEFLPLFNYPLSALKGDIIKALKAKRDFYVVDDYKNYLSSVNQHKYEFNQFKAPYRSSDWADIAILLHQDKMEEFISTYTNQLEKVEWV